MFNQEIMLPRAFFDRLRATRPLASECQGKIEFIFTGYDKDSRELCQIPEVRDYVSLLDKVLPDIFFFASAEESTYTLLTFLFCQVDFEFVDRTDAVLGHRKLSFDTRQALEFVTRHCPALNELTEWLDLSQEEEERIFNNVVERLGLGTARDN